MILAAILPVSLPVCSPNRGESISNVDVKPFAKPLVEGSLAPRGKSLPFTTIGRFFRNIHNITVYGLLALVGAGLTPGVSKVFNSTLQSDFFSAAPVPSGLLQEPIKINNVKYDGFLSNFSELKTFIKALEVLGIEPKTLDLNKSGVVLDSSEELKSAFKILENGLISVSDSESKNTLNTAIGFLKDYYLLSTIVWGEDGALKDKISQNEEPNCQTMSAFRGLFFTESSIQNIKQRVKIISYDLDGNKPSINFEVLVTGKWMPISYEEVKNASCPEGYNASASKDNSLFTALFKAACNKASTATVPNWWPSTSSILLTDKNYIPMLTVALSDNELGEILSNAPNEIVTVTGNFDLGDIRNGINLRNVDWKSPAVSKEKAEQFDSTLMATARGLKPEAKEGDQVTSTSKINPSSVFISIEPTSIPLVESSFEIKAPTTNSSMPTSSFPPSAISTHQSVTNVEPLSANFVRNGHVYVVEKFDNATQTLIISDAHGDRVKLNGMKEIREHLSGVIFDQDDISNLGERTLPLYLGLAGLALLFSGSKRGVKFVFKGLANKSRQTT